MTNVAYVAYVTDISNVADISDVTEISLCPWLRVRWFCWDCLDCWQISRLALRAGVLLGMGAFLRAGGDFAAIFCAFSDHLCILFIIFAN